MDPITILYTFLAVVQVVLTMLPGVYYGRTGLGDAAFRRSLSVLTYNCLLPALILYNIASQVSASTILDYIPFALNVLFGCAGGHCKIVVGVLLGWIANMLARTPSHLRFHVVAVSGFGNTNALPLLLVQAVCAEDSLPFYDALGGQCTATGIGYLAVGFVGLQIGFPMCTWLLRKRDLPKKFIRALTRAITLFSHNGRRRSGRRGSLAMRELPPIPSERELEAMDGQAPPLAPPAGAGQPDAVCAGAAAAASAAPEPALVVVSHTAPETEGDGSSSSSSKCSSGAEGGAEQQQAPAPLAQPPARPRWWRVVWHFILSDVLHMPTVGAAAGVLIGCVPPLKDLFFPSTTAPLGFVAGATNVVQASYPFVSSFINGAVLAKGPGAGTASLGWRPVLLVVCIRFALLPALGAVVVAATIRAGWYKCPNPLYAFILLLTHCVPAGNQPQTLATMNNNHEQEMGALIFWTWAAALVAVPAWMACFVWMIEDGMLSACSA